MIQLTPQMRIVAAIEPVDFRCGIDGLARLCKEMLKHDPFNGWVFVFRNRSARTCWPSAASRWPRRSRCAMR